MRTSSVLLLTIVAVVAIYGGYAKASIIPLGGVVVLHPDGSAAVAAANEAAQNLANSIQEAGNQAVSNAQVAADAAGVNAQAIVDAVQAANERVAAAAEAQAQANAVALANAQIAAENLAAAHAV
ncbi:hypothetical protein FF38_05293 [Lucilia cuprina]|uniref:Uncharacterized protein n=1 Tax=Lucilia cuprina TaxID=7375 RepID=A0A0L0CL43_LUCCU|nr:uncharacterized protein LOC111688321 [Lucilia cuprina]KNC33015.1 hypothetical protein FF38_05293 [Lucilia cuprina]